MIPEEIKKQFSQFREVDEEITLARNNPDEFWKILRKSQDYGNANFKTFGDKKNYQNNIVTKESALSQFEKLKDENFRFSAKTDQGPGKNNITDAPGFGSVRLSPPYEDPNFDRDYFNFLNSLIKPEDSIADLGGGLGHLLHFLKDCKNKVLIEKNGVQDEILPPVQYLDADEFNNNFDLIFCYHCIEHLSEPEKVIENLIKRSNKFFVFASPLKEIIETSIHHYVFVELEIIQRILGKYNKILFYHISKYSPLDLHCIVFNDDNLLRENYKNEFLKKYFKPLKTGIK